MPKMSKEGQLAFNDLMGKFTKAVPNIQAQKIIGYGLGGAAAGALGLGGAAWLREKDKDEDERASVLLPMLAGAIGGGTSGAALGWNLGNPNGPTTGQKDLDVPTTQAARDAIAKVLEAKRLAHANHPWTKVKDFLGDNKLSTGIAALGGTHALTKAPAGLRRAAAEAHHNYRKSNPFKFDFNSGVNGINPSRVLSKDLASVQKELSLINPASSTVGVGNKLDDLIRKHTDPSDPMFKALHALKDKHSAAYAAHKTNIRQARPTLGAKVRGGLKAGRGSWIGTGVGILGDIIYRKFTGEDAAPAAETK